MNYDITAWIMNYDITAVYFKIFKIPESNKRNPTNIYEAGNYKEKLFTYKSKQKVKSDLNTLKINESH